jgi:hypothetical protein
LKAIHTPAKIETITLSFFQSIGLLYQMADHIVDRQPQCAPIAIHFFKSRLIELGFPSETSEILLGAHNWKTRMYFAWTMMNEVERKKATAFDYNEYQNYWPTLDFCRPDWASEVEIWMSSPESDDDVIDFIDIANVNYAPEHTLH